MDRRRFLSQIAATPIALHGLRRSLHAGLLGLPDPPAGEAGYGPLVADPDGLLDLPEGFVYSVLSARGERMDDGWTVPAAHDGMAAFAGPGGLTVLVRNHELVYGEAALGAFGEAKADWSDLADDGLIYDRGVGDGPTLGGTTTLVYDTARRRVVRHFLSLAGTVRNCSGGATPWNSWITCEESIVRPAAGHAVDHGYNFEVPATGVIGIVEPVPLKAMGRFNHESVCVDPTTGIVYQTEDRGDSLFYRFVPDRPGELREGGRLQALRVLDQPGADLRNWRAGDRVGVGAKLRVEWADLDDVESPDDDLRHQGTDDHECALFARGEGMTWGRDGAYFACTSGGPATRGQIWHYVPDRAADPDVDPAAVGGTLSLFVEPDDESRLDMCDNLTVCPWGDLLTCEDGTGEQRLIGVTPAGQCYVFARNARSTSEFAGATVSPDGTTLFVNIQGLGLTLAITGPWRRAAHLRD